MPGGVKKECWGPPEKPEGGVTFQAMWGGWKKRGQNWGNEKIKGGKGENKSDNLPKGQKTMGDNVLGGVGQAHTLI